MNFNLINDTVKANCMRSIQSLPVGQFRVAITDKKSKRSIDQNSRYWAIIKIVGDHVGMHKDELHRMFSIRLLGPELFVVDGKQYVGAKSTTSLSVPEFTEYLANIEAAAMELGVVIPSAEFYGMER